MLLLEWVVVLVFLQKFYFQKALRLIFLGVGCLFALSCEQSGGSAEVDVDGTNFVFKPIFRGGSNPSDFPLGTPLAAANLTATAGRGEILIEFNVPKIYVTPSLSIGYRIFRHINTGSDIHEWDFSTRSALDWTKETALVRASECSPDGVCSYIDRLGANARASYAVTGYWDIDNYDSEKSGTETAEATSLLNQVFLTFDPGFTELPPTQVFGIAVGDADRSASAEVFQFNDDLTPWYLLEPKESQSSQAGWKRTASAIFPGFSSDFMRLLMPDPGFNRQVMLYRGDPAQECSIFPDQSLELCLAIIASRPVIPIFALGQQTLNHSKDLAQNELDESRKFKGRAARIDKSESGNTYQFVADEARILVRLGDVVGCDFDQGVANDDDPAGLCGFHWSIGTYSPRQRCAFKSTGENLLANEKCEAADMAYSLADGTAPSKFSLRKPGVPRIVGKHLYIPDSGNARLLRLANFEEQFQTCGRLLSDTEEQYAAARLEIIDSFILNASTKGAQQNGIKIQIKDDLNSVTGVSVGGAGTEADPYFFDIQVGTDFSSQTLADFIAGNQVWTDLSPGASALFRGTFEIESFVPADDLALGLSESSGGADPSNSFCEFDMVVGQYGATPADPDRFTKRDCVRGGERGGFSGAGELAPTAPFEDPLGTGAEGGFSCRLNTYQSDLLDPTTIRPSRIAADYRDETRSDMSPETGLLTERTRRMFRAPLSVDVDEKGWIYVMDAGVTRVRSGSSDFEATLPSRIMVWRRDPFKTQECVPLDPAAAVPSCEVSGDGICSGEGCLDRQCEESECSAQIFIGQSADLFGFIHQTGQVLGEDFKPEGYFPLAAFDLGIESNMKGVWAVTGRDAKILHFREISQTELPVVHNDLAAVGEGEDTSFKTGIFIGILVDRVAQKITALETILSRGVVWSGELPPPN